MAEPTSKTSEPLPESPPPNPGPPGWSDLWQMPVLLLGIFLLATWGVLMVRTPGNKEDFAGAIQSAAQYLKANNFEAARAKINEILPHINRAAPAENAMLMQLWGDL